MSLRRTMAGLWPQVILFGDSITQQSFGAGGWGALLADKLQRKCDVVNRGFSGYNTNFAKVALPRVLPKAQLAHVPALTLFYGANDAAFQDNSSTCQYVFLSDYASNLKEMITYLQDGGLDAAKIVLITPPPLHDKKWAEHCMNEYGNSVPNRSNENTGLYAKACCTVAKDHGIDVVDLYTTMQQEPNWGNLLNDGLHLSPEGNTFAGEQIWKVLAPKTQNLAIQLPDWKDVDPSHPEIAILKN